MQPIKAYAFSKTPVWRTQSCALRMHMAVGENHGKRQAVVGHPEAYTFLHNSTRLP